MNAALARAVIVGTLAALLLLFAFAGFSGGLRPTAALLVTLLLSAAAALAVFLALRRASSRGASRPEPPAVGEVEVRRIPKGPVSACLRCGSMEIHPAPLGADALFSQWRCSRCGWRGQPLQFDSGEEYAAFVKGLRQERGEG